MKQDGGVTVVQKRLNPFLLGPKRDSERSFDPDWISSHIVLFAGGFGSLLTIGT